MIKLFGRTRIYELELELESESEFQLQELYMNHQKYTNLFQERSDDCVAL